MLGGGESDHWNSVRNCHSAPCGNRTVLKNKWAPDECLASRCNGWDRWHSLQGRGPRTPEQLPAGVTWMLVQLLPEERPAWGGDMGRMSSWHTPNSNLPSERDTLSLLENTMLMTELVWEGQSPQGTEKSPKKISPLATPSSILPTFPHGSVRHR